MNEFSLVTSLFLQSPETVLVTLSEISWVPEAEVGPGSEEEEEEEEDGVVLEEEEVVEVEAAEEEEAEPEEALEEEALEGEALEGEEEVREAASLLVALPDSTLLV